MITMYEIMKSTIAGGNYKLHDVQHRIKRLFLLGDLTEDQFDELYEMATGRASADAERPGTAALIQTLAEKIDALEARVTALDGGNNGSADGSGDAEQPVYTEWKPWDGISKDYANGAIVSHNGKLWESCFEGQNVWEPGAVGTESLWSEYEPGADES